MAGYGRKGEQIEKRTPEVESVFLAGLRSGLTVSDAASAAGISSRAVYRWKLVTPKFGEKWAEAYRQGADALARAARKRAVKGVKKTIYYRGVPIGFEVNYSDTLLIFLMKARDPEQYCERVRAAKIAAAWAKADADGDDLPALRKAAQDALAALDAAVSDKAATQEEALSVT